MSVIAGWLAAIKRRLKRSYRKTKKELELINLKYKEEKRENKEEYAELVTKGATMEETHDAIKGREDSGLARERRVKQLKAGTYFVRIQVMTVLEYIVRVFVMLVKALVYLMGPLLTIVVLIAALVLILLTSLFDSGKLNFLPDDLEDVEEEEIMEDCTAAWTLEELATRGINLTDEEKNLYRLIMLSRQLVEGELTGEQVYGDEAAIAMAFSVGISSTETGMQFYNSKDNHSNILEVPSDKGLNSSGYGLFGVKGTDKLENYLDASQISLLKGQYQPVSPPMTQNNYAPYGVVLQMYHFKKKLDNARSNDTYAKAKEMGAKFGIVETIDEFATFCELSMAQAGYHGMQYHYEERGYLAFWAALWASTSDDDSQRGVKGNIEFIDAGFDESGIRHTFVGTYNGKVRRLGSTGGPRDFGLNTNYSSRLKLGGEVLQEPLWGYLDKKFKGKVPEWDEAWKTQQGIHQRSLIPDEEGVGDRTLNFTYGPTSFIQGTMIMEDIESKLVGDSCGPSGSITGGMELDVNTLTNVMKGAVEAIGKVLYTWGGGRTLGPPETGGTIEGIDPVWVEYYNSYKDADKYFTVRLNITEANRRNGMDCSGFIGWLLGNTRYDNTNYALLSNQIGPLLASRDVAKRVTPSYNDYRPGDIFGDPIHVFMVVGPSEHGGAVIVHSSPKGVKLAGIGGGVKTATEYMQRYYARDVDTSRSFNLGNLNVSHYVADGHAQYRFNIVEEGVREGIEDPDGLFDKSAEEILAMLYGEVDGEGSIPGASDDAGEED